MEPTNQNYFSQEGREKRAGDPGRGSQREEGVAIVRKAAADLAAGDPDQWAFSITTLMNAYCTSLVDFYVAGAEFNPVTEKTIQDEIMVFDTTLRLMFGIKGVDLRVPGHAYDALRDLGRPAPAAPANEEEHQ
jgi:hypothetical protein